MESASQKASGLAPCYTCQSVRRVFLVPVLAAVASAAFAQKADLVVVKKSESRLYLERSGKQFASFKVAFGGNPKGHKQQQGDERTPEGRYVLDSKNAKSGYYKAIHISYPNARDMAAATAKGVDPGGLTMIHGQKNGFAGFLRDTRGIA